MDLHCPLERTVAQNLSRIDKHDMKQLNGFAKVCPSPFSVVEFPCLVNGLARDDLSIDISLC